jgi:hypothetical protein
MTIKQAFEIYKVENGKFKYCPFRNAVDKFFIDNKEELNVLNKNSINEIKSYLKHNEHRWFVFYLLNIVSNLPEELFKPLMNEILSFGGDSWRHGSIYDNMARLYSFEKVEFFLQNEFLNSYSDIYKRAVVEAMWRNSYSIPFVIPDDDINFITEYRYIWKDNCYQFIEFFPESQESAALYLAKQEALIQKRYKILLEYFLNRNIKIEFLHDCSPLLPRKKEKYLNENFKLFDSFVEKLRELKSDKNSSYSVYLSNPSNNWEWI